MDQALNTSGMMLALLVLMVKTLLEIKSYQQEKIVSLFLRQDFMESLMKLIMKIAITPNILEDISEPQPQGYIDLLLQLMIRLQYISQTLA